jgi:hypothetical protein
VYAAGASELVSLSNNSNAPGVEAMMIMETLHSVAEQLLAQDRLYQHPAVFWTAAALLRCDQASLYRAALRLLNTVLPGLPFLYVSPEPLTRGRGESTLDVPNPAAMAAAAASSANADRAPPSSAMPDDFWSYCEKWTPKFEGVQPYVLLGMQAPASEPDAMAALSSLMRVAASPTLVDAKLTRHLITILAFLPPLYREMTSARTLGSAFGVQVAQTLTDLASVAEGSLPELRQCVLSVAESWIKHGGGSKSRSGRELEELANSFLSKTCARLADAFFPRFAGPCAEYLASLLHSDYREHHSVVLKITKEFLLHPKAFEFVNDFASIIATAHAAVTLQKRGGAMDSVSMLPASFVEPAAGRAGGSDGHLLRIAEPAADVIATVVALFTRQKKEGSARPAAENPARIRALPIHSLHSTIEALNQVLQCAPMLPKK